MKQLLILFLAVLSLAARAQTDKPAMGLREVNGVLNWRNSPKGPLKGPPASTGATADGSETKIVQGSNVTVTGTGTSASPYVINSTATGGSGSSSINNQIVVMTPTVAAIQAAIDQVGAGQSGFRIILGFNFCTFGDAESITIKDKTFFTLDLNGASLIAGSSRTMIWVDGNCKSIRLTNGKIFNNSPTLPYNSKYGYFATITSTENAQIDGWEIDHIEGTTPNADQNFILNSTYRDVANNPGSTAILRNMQVHHCYLHDIGRMGWEVINGGPTYGDNTRRHGGLSFAYNYCRNLGLQSPLDKNNGMAVSIDGPGWNSDISHNRIWNARGAGIEVVNGVNVTIVGNTIQDETDNAGPGCNGISVTDNHRYLTYDITISANTVNVKGRALLLKEVSAVTVTGNSFKSILGNDFITKRCTFTGNYFHALAPVEPVVLFHLSGEGNGDWTSTENKFSGNTVTNVNPNKPGGYGGPYQLLSLRDWSRWNVVSDNFFIRDPAAGNFPRIEYGANSEQVNNYIGVNYERDARDLNTGH